jgi:uncharacterized protein (DUF488 family)
LRAHAIQRLADVRRYPVSRRQPHFTRDALALALPRAGIHYVHLGELGGHREERPGSPHTALAGAFRGYADHMQTPEFARGVARLEALARERRTALMCAEARFEDCHRRFLCDALLARGARVVHVRTGAPEREHALHPAAHTGAGGWSTRARRSQACSTRPGA